MITGLMELIINKNLVPYKSILLTKFLYADTTILQAYKLLKLTHLYKSSETIKMLQNKSNQFTVAQNMLKQYE